MVREALLHPRASEGEAAPSVGALPVGSWRRGAPRRLGCGQPEGLRLGLERRKWTGTPTVAAFWGAGPRFPAPSSSFKSRGWANPCTP